MTDRPGESHGDGGPTPARSPLPWDDFGVPHGGHPDPAPAPETAPLPSAWGTPWPDASTATAPPPSPYAAPAPAGPPAGEPYGTGYGSPAGPAYGQPSAGDPWGGDPTSGMPVGPATPPAKERRRRGGVATVGIALVSALVGGGVVAVGNHYLGSSAPGISLGSSSPTPGPGATSRPDGSIAKIAATALPSVVTIKITASGGSGTGSGFVIDGSGHVLTNNHVVSAAGGAGTITVELNNGTELPATVVGKDASYDLAVLKINTADVPPLAFGRSADVVVGDGVIAVGAPLGLEATVTSGIVSALDRPVTPGDGTSFINAIQTDAAINPGNSGGPLLDMSGKVIGVNSAIARVPGSTSESGGNIGVGFSIPSDQAAKTAQQLITTGKAVHPVLGVNVDRTYTGAGAKIAAGGVPSGSAAAKAGLQAGDVITSFEGKKVIDADTLIVAVRARDVGDTVKLTVQRGGSPTDVTMTLQGATG